MKTLIYLGVAFFVLMLLWLAGSTFTPGLQSEVAGNLLVITFVVTAVITSLVLKYRQGRTEMSRRILVSVAAGVVDFTCLYVTCSLPHPPMFTQDAAMASFVSALLVSVVTFTLLSLPPRLSGEWRRAIISLSVAFFAAVLINVQLVCFAKEVQNLKSIFAGVFIVAAVITSLSLRQWSRRS